MRHYGNLLFHVLLLVEILAVLAAGSEWQSGTGESSFLVNIYGVIVAIANGLLMRWLYHKGKLGNVDDIEE